MENNQEKKITTVVEIVDEGPLIITGNIAVQDVKRDLTEYAGELYLCRCGRSINKPFCDGEHLACECMDDGSKGPENNGGNK